MNKMPVLDADSDALFESPNMTGTPERNLLMAILERAMLDYVGNDEKEAQAAKDWIFGDLEESRPTEFSFPWVCGQLDLDTLKIAQRIKRMPKRKERRIAPWYFAREQILAGAA